MPDVQWLHPRLTGPGPVLICFPVAGASYWSLRSWYRTAAEPAVHVVSLPGRGRRVREPSYTGMADLVRDVADALAPALDHPFALYGHSMGALCAHALAVHLARTGGPRPAGLFVSGQVAPHVRRPFRAETMDDTALAGFLAAHDMLPAAARDEPELAALVLAAIRADLTVCDSYAHLGDEPLDVPITAFAARGDVLTDPGGVEQWRRHTSSVFRLETIDGAHILSPDEANRVLRTIRAAWRGLVPA
ncbi:thioesterase II family protein [Dactylosporangium sp. CA-233914]|uniref:thioesterase II family protein n=1 Tax=Dactylosporangium sp. CA-233914 TaxID=3239934 RepID=UPI003D94E8DA